MSIETQARALVIRHQNLVQHRQQCMLSRAAAEVGVPGEAVQAWSHNRGKANPPATGDADSPRVGLS